MLGCGVFRLLFFRRRQQAEKHHSKGMGATARAWAPHQGQYEMFKRHHKLARCKAGIVVTGSGHLEVCGNAGGVAHVGGCAPAGQCAFAWSTNET